MSRPDPDAGVLDGAVPAAAVPDAVGSGVAGEIVRVRRFAEVVRAARRAARGVESHPVWGDREAEALTAVRVVSAFLDHHAHTDVAQVFVNTLLRDLADLTVLGEVHRVSEVGAHASAAVVTGSAQAGVVAAAGADGAGAGDSVRDRSERVRRRRSATRRVIAHEGDVPLALWPLGDVPSDIVHDIPCATAGVISGPEIGPEVGTSSGVRAGAAEDVSGEEAAGGAAVGRDQGGPGKAAPTPTPTSTSPPRSSVSVGAVRVWAQAQGYPVGARGRLSGQVRDAYLRAHPELLDPGGSGLETGGHC
ncbi:Lsr2 family protein [Pseudonocardia sp. ICBG601]|uniref:Lsr2 family protein n=1 Tax=Pseudonocardia sp. ICBG601 TaxID=2846759 RepID=UPI0021F5C66A|nr:Lsr2 family protein [Pseudonocardia sp. ICBG601]